MIIALAVAAATAWGLILLVLLLVLSPSIPFLTQQGYGLVEIPKRFWQRADRQWVLRYYRQETFQQVLILSYLAVQRKEAVERAKKELEVTLKVVYKMF